MTFPKHLLTPAVVTVMCFVGAPGAFAADAKHGEALYQSCAACHSPLLGDSPGPDLRGVFGRKAGAVPNFHYSKAMKNSSLVWNEATLRAFLRNPQARVPGTTMAFPGYSNPTTVDDVVAYMKTMK